MDSTDEYDEVAELETLIVSYDELAQMMSAAQTGPMPSQTLRKLNQQLRDHVANILSDLEMSKMLLAHMQELRKQDKAESLEAA